MNIHETVLPPVDNLWNNSIVGANVSVKTENVVSYIDESGKVLSPAGETASFYGPIAGRLPSKRLEPLSDESDEDDEEINMNRGEELNCSTYSQQNLIPR